MSSVNRSVRSCYNAQALQMMVTANRATPDTIGEILSDIQTPGRPRHADHRSPSDDAPSHQLDKKPIDLHAVIDESLALVAHDMSARQVEATVDLSSSPCVINGDPVLLQQVLVNLVMNAMDAMAETPPARRHITIRSEVRAADVDVSVRDTGPGLPAEIVDTLFTPFVTTKAHGLGIGLTIVADDRRRARRHHRRPQQSRRGRDVHRHAAPQRIGGAGCRRVTLGEPMGRTSKPARGRCCRRG